MKKRTVITTEKCEFWIIRNGENLPDYHETHEPRTGDHDLPAAVADESGPPLTPTKEDSP